MSSAGAVPRFHPLGYTSRLMVLPGGGSGHDAHDWAESGSGALAARTPPPPYLPKLLDTCRCDKWRVLFGRIRQTRWKNDAPCKCAVVRLACPNKVWVQSLVVLGKMAALVIGVAPARSKPCPHTNFTYVLVSRHCGIGRGASLARRPQITGGFTIARQTACPLQLRRSEVDAPFATSTRGEGRGFA